GRGHRLRRGRPPRRGVGVGVGRRLGAEHRRGPVRRRPPPPARVRRRVGQRHGHQRLRRVPALRVPERPHRRLRRRRPRLPLRLLRRGTMTRTLRALLAAATAASATLLAACGGDGPTGPAPADARAPDPVPAQAAPAHHAGHPSALPAGELPGTSLFHLASAWTDQDGAPFALPDLRGKPSVFVMFYGDCTTACPLLVKAAEDIEAALPAELRG